MREASVPLTALSEAQRAQALERFAIIRPSLEEGVHPGTGRSYPSDRSQYGAVLKEKQ